ncbi:MAG: MAPEG family protein [Pseudomonadota bacterium]
MPLPVTAFFAGVLSLWIIFLLSRVVRLRRRHRILMGSGPENEAERAIRGHANATETIPVFLILMGLAEGFATPAWLLVLIALLFTAGRIMHGLHFLTDQAPLTTRTGGMVLTISPIVLLSLGAIGHALLSLL